MRSSNRWYSIWAALWLSAICWPAVVMAGDPAAPRDQFEFIKPEPQPVQDLELEVADIFAASCAFAGCHSGASAERGLDLSEEVFKANLVNVKSQDKPQFVLVMPGDAAKSYLIGKLRGTPNIAGDRMPRGSQPLPDEELAIIVRWINSLPAGMQMEKPKQEYALAFPGMSLTNLPTAETLPTGAFLYRVAHRFKLPTSAGFDQMFGLDGGAYMMGELGFPLSNSLFATVKRSGLNATFEFAAKWRLLRQKTEGSTPLSLALFAGTDWQTTKQLPDPANPTNNMSRTAGERFSYFAQMPITRQFGSKLSLGVIPGVLLNGNVQVTNEDALVTLGVIGKYWFNRKYGLYAEFVPILSGDQTADVVGGRTIQSDGSMVFYDTFTAGVEIFVGGHVFHVFLSNSGGNTTNQYMSGGNLDFADGDFRLGFNIYRMLNYPF